MSTVKLKNKYRTNTVPGTLVRVDPNDSKSFIYVELSDLDAIGTIADTVRPGNFATINLINTVDVSSLLGEDFETVSKNLKSYPYDLIYGADGIDTIVYDLGGGLSITKTFNYVATVLTTIILSGDTPSDIKLTKTLNYTGDDLTNVIYS
jgi:hypothetical protein